MQFLYILYFFVLCNLIFGLSAELPSGLPDTSLNFAIKVFIKIENQIFDNLRLKTKENMQNLTSSLKFANNFRFEAQKLPRISNLRLESC